MADKLKPTTEEEEFFQREDAEKKLRLRHKRQLEAVRQKERAEIARELNTNDDVAQEAMSLGFDAETARVLPLIPLIQVAWADGKITNAEAAKVTDKAEKFGLKQDTPAHAFLLMLLEEQPTDLFFDRVNQVIRHIVSDDPGGDISTNVLPWSKAVAEASGGFFGLTNPIHKKEQQVLDEFAELFGISFS